MFSAVPGGKRMRTFCDSCRRRIAQTRKAIKNVDLKIKRIESRRSHSKEYLHYQRTLYRAERKELMNKKTKLERPQFLIQ